MKKIMGAVWKLPAKLHSHSSPIWVAAMALAAMAPAANYGPGSHSPGSYGPGSFGPGSMTLAAMALAANYICPGSCVEQGSFNINFSLEQDELFEDSYNINGETPNEQNHTDVSD